MKIAEYFKEKQVINDEIENSIFYKNYSTIDFVYDENHYVKILIAHPEELTWSLGWEIRGMGKQMFRKDCTSNVLTKGYIERLIFGMLRMIQIKMPSKASGIMKRLVFNAILEADRYYDKNIKFDGKIKI